MAIRVRSLPYLGSRDTRSAPLRLIGCAFREFRSLPFIDLLRMFRALFRGA
jgi:hypothetical protein